MLENKISKIYNYFCRRQKLSNGIHIVLNITSFVIAAGVVILNLYAIRKNPAKDNEIVIIMFVVTSILAGIGGVFAAMMSFFVFRKKALKAKDKAELISHERNLWKNKEERYQDKDRDEIIIQRVTKILDD